MEIFSFSPPTNLYDERRWLLAVASFEATVSVFKRPDENNSFSISTPGHWSCRGGAETIYKLQNLLELRAQNDIELHVKKVKKTGNRIKVGDNDNNLSDLDTHKNDIIEESKNVEYNNLVDMVFRMVLTYSEIADMIGTKNFATPSVGYSLTPGKHASSDTDLLLKSSLPNDVDITNDDFRLRSILISIKMLKITKKSFFSTTLGFTQSNSGPLDDIKGFKQLILSVYKSDKPINITGFDEIPLKCDCF